MSLSLVSGNGIVSADTPILVLNPVLYTDTGTGDFHYDLYLKSTNANVTGKWQLWSASGGAYGDIAGSAVTANSETIKSNVTVDANSIGKLNIDYTSTSGTPTALEYWYALRGPGLPSSLERQGSGSGAYTREFFLDPTRNYTFTTNKAGAGFTWKYYDGAAWVAYTNGTDSSFVATPPTSGRVQVVFTGGGDSVWALKAHPK